MDFNPSGPGLDASALHRQATAALARQDYSSATQAGIAALIAAAKAHGPNSEPVAMILCTLGAALSSDWPCFAECLLNAAVGLASMRDQPPDELSATLHSNLSVVYKETGRFELAVNAAERCVRVRES